MCVVGDGEKHGDTRNWWDAERCDNWTFALEFGCEESSSHRGDDLDGTEGDVEQDGAERIEAEGVDNQWAESRDASRWD